MTGDTVGDLAEVYLGNILYALERAAETLDTEGKTEDGAFYRGIARVLAEARGRALRSPETPQNREKGNA